ncbi:hypothetical protein AGMMS49975_05860 [Clostridia bacterium]|nr:hypothetical protein AGMMS49975_05860 [Clostridia bacterium]
MSNTNNELANTTPEQQTPTPPVALTSSQRFTNMVIREYATNAAQGAIQLNEQQRRLVQGYFVMVDRALKTADDNRLRKNKGNRNHQYDNLIPYDWQHVNMTDLALDAVHYARMGLDMQEKNHLFPIPYANKKNNNYNITFTIGYSGIQYISEKYALTPPKSVTIEVVYSNDVFKALKKCATKPYDAYEFEIVNAFDRGEIVGGFGYIEYDEPTKNELVIMKLSDIKKRAGKNANAEFWGTEFTGKKVQEWENGERVMKDAEGWLDEMCRKTLIREVYSGKHIPRDPSKIDDSYQYLREREVVYAQAEVENDTLENANTIPIDTPKEPLKITDGGQQESKTEQSAPPISDGVTDPDF